MMGRRDKIAELERITAEAQSEIEVIREAGGTAFMLDYNRYLRDLKEAEDQHAVALTGKRFRKRAVQVAAVAAMKDWAVMETAKENAPEINSEKLGQQIETAAKAAYVGAAGHFENDPLGNLPEPGPDAAARRQKAAADWDRLIKTDPNSLISLSIYGHDTRHSTPIPLMEHVKGIGSLLFLVVAAVGAYYVWSSR
jgi:hypothetical protein